MTSRRIQRINHLLRSEIAELLQREIRDDALLTSLISVTEVDTSPDLKNAKVYYSVYGEEEDVLTARTHLEHAARFLRNSLRGKLDLRVLPNLEFIYDPSLARGDRIMRLIRAIEETHVSEEEQAEPDPS